MKNVVSESAITVSSHRQGFKVLILAINCVFQCEKIKTRHCSLSPLYHVIYRSCVYSPDFSTAWVFGSDDSSQQLDDTEKCFSQDRFGFEIKVKVSNTHPQLPNRFFWIRLMDTEEILRPCPAQRGFRVWKSVLFWRRHSRKISVSGLKRLL